MRVKAGRKYIGRFGFGRDLLGELEGFCRTERIAVGVFTVIGALTRVRLGYYDRKAKKYVSCVQLSDVLEITSCTGNISMSGQDVFVHAHITLADHQGKCTGGHLMSGSRIFAAEYDIQELTGGKLHRVPDKETGLRLWRM